MHHDLLRFVAAILAVACCPYSQSISRTAGSGPPATWIDPDTGHRIVRLTREPGSASLYFNQNGYTADGQKMIYTTREGISVLNLNTHATKPVVEGRVRVIVAGRKTQSVYYLKDDVVFSTDVDTGLTRQIAKVPPRGSVATVNADETLLAGTYIEGDGEDYGGRNRAPQPQQLDQPVNKGQMMEQRLAAHLPMGLFTIDVKTGEVKTILKSTDWLNHLEFSPTDPALLMFCHEGPGTKSIAYGPYGRTAARSTRCIPAQWPWRSRDMSSGAPMARSSGTICKRRVERTSG